jgi:hypothetical protein
MQVNEGERFIVSPFGLELYHQQARIYMVLILWKYAIISKQMKNFAIGKETDDAHAKLDRQRQGSKPPPRRAVSRVGF